MISSRAFHINKLGAKLTLYALISVGFALAVFFVAQAGANHALDAMSADEAFEEKQNALVASDVQQYVRENDLSIADANRLWDMPGVDVSFFIMLYSDGALIDAQGEVGYYLNKEDTGRLYPISFSDGEMQMYIWNYGYYASYYRIADAVCCVLAFIAFVTLFVCLIRKKLRYILQLEQELSLLEGGDLEHAITVRGNDELGSLARGIDDMRRSFIERQQGEAEAIRANQSLVTAMSHDLRTPLTSLLGYIELMQSGQYADEAQLRHFISASRNKVYRIKEMTDALFEYALCSGGESPAQLRSIDAYKLFSQLITEHAFELESAGFKTTLLLPAFRASVQADPVRLARVFDNISSNIKKYADPAQEVRLELSLAGTWVRICVVNRANAKSAAESNHIGLKTCERILQQHNGRFSAQCVDGSFSVTIELPVWDDE